MTCLLLLLVLSFCLPAPAPGEEARTALQEEAEHCVMRYLAVLRSLLRIHVFPYEETSIDTAFDPEILETEMAAVKAGKRSARRDSAIGKVRGLTRTTLTVDAGRRFRFALVTSTVFLPTGGGERDNGVAWRLDSLWNDQGFQFPDHDYGCM